MVSLFDRAIAEGIGFSGCVSLGNQSDLEICDFLEYFIDDPATDAICVYIEGLRDPARFVRAAAACRRAGKPMVVRQDRKDERWRAGRSFSYCQPCGQTTIHSPRSVVRTMSSLSMIR